MEDAHDPRRLRDAFGCFATGVTLVSTINPEGGITAVTANSFTSVSLDPPLLLFCLDKRSRRLPVFEAADTFAVNVLQAGQEGLSTQLARGDGCDSRDWRMEGGAPILQDAMAAFACSREAVHEGGDHLIFIGRVQRLKCDLAADPLLYFQGRYSRVHVPR